VELHPVVALWIVYVFKLWTHI